MGEIENKKYISWPVLAFMAFSTVIGFDDLIYNFKNQGLGVITSWIILLSLYMIPYSLMVGQLGSTFNKEGGGLSSWLRGTKGDAWGYFTAWTYWAAMVPYVVESANAVVVGIGWMINGDNSLADQLTTSKFALLTFVVFVIFVFIQLKVKNLLEILGTIGGAAMFIMCILFIVMALASLMMPGTKMATQPIELRTFVPKFNLHYLTTIALLIYAINGSELVAPYVTRMKKPAKEFPKAMIFLTIMAAILTIFGSFSLGIFFDANNLPHDLKMNGSYYAFLALGERYGLGKILMYLYALISVTYMSALLAVLLDAMTRMLISDTGEKYMPKALLKKNERGLPVNGYLLTAGLSAFILILPIFGLKNINLIFDWLLQLNGIISPFVTCWIFYAFMQIRKNSQKYKAEYVFIKNDKIAYLVGFWCLAITFAASIFGMIPQGDPSTFEWKYTLAINILAPTVLIGLGGVMPWLASRERKREQTKL